MSNPVSGNIVISEVVSNFREGENKRLCLEKRGEGSWEVTFAKPEELNALSWHDAHHGIWGVINSVWDSFSRNPSSVDRVLLDIRLQAIEEEDNTRVAYDIITQNGAAYGNRDYINEDDMKLNIYDMLLDYASRTDVFSQETIGYIRTHSREGRRIQRSRPLDQQQEMDDNVKKRLFIEIKRADVSEKPLKILDQIGEAIEARVTSKPKIHRLHTTYSGEPGVDAEGLSAELIFDLIKVLTDPQQQQNLEGLEFVEGGIPSLSSEKGQKRLHTLGVLLGQCIIIDGYRIGPTFDARFYALLTSLPPPPVQPNDYATYAKAYKGLNSEDRLVKCFHTPLKDLKPEEKQFLLDHAALHNDFSNDMQKNPDAHWNTILHLIDKVIGEDIAPDNTKVQAALHIAEGMATACEWEEICGKSPEELRTTIEGAFSKELLKTRLTAIDDDSLQWMHRWIDEATEEQCIRFIKTTTSSHTLGTKEIDLRVEDSLTTNHLPIFSTCFYRVTIPNYPNYDTFKQKLHKSLAEAIGFSNV